jgi:hypothetical protein
MGSSPKRPIKAPLEENRGDHEAQVFALNIAQDLQVVLHTPPQIDPRRGEHGVRSAPRS